MNRARAAALVLLDASPFYRFCEAQLLPSLAEYLRRNARVTPEVATELRRGARSSRHTGLRYLELAGWPPETAALPAELQRPFLDYSRAARQNDELPSKHAGEITTVLMAAHIGADVVVIDDLFGKRLARDRGVPACRPLSWQSKCSRKASSPQATATACSTCRRHLRPAARTSHGLATGQALHAIDRRQVATG